MKDTKVQWHPGFVAAMNLELAKNRGDLEFIKEYNLNTKPLEIDLLIIKKDTGVSIDNEIGAIFRGHNIVEYKSPEDHLDVDTFYKVVAYACLYKSYGDTVDAIKADDVTVSLVRDTKPEGLFKYFEEHEYAVENPYGGVYYVSGMVMFPTQIIVTKELETDVHIWLRALSDRIGKLDMAELLKKISQLTEQRDREFADSVLEVSVQVNMQVLEELKGDDSVSEALLEIMQPLVEPIIEARLEPIIEARLEPVIEARMEPVIEARLEPVIEARLEPVIEARMEPIIEARMEPQILLREEAAKRTGWEEGLGKGIQGMVDALHDLGHEDAEIRQIIQKKYALSEEEAAEYL